MAAACFVITAEYLIWKKRNQIRDAMDEQDKLAQDEAGVTGDHHHSFRYAL
jgi:hypothetical protein